MIKSVKGNAPSLLATSVCGVATSTSMQNAIEQAVTNNLGMVALFGVLSLVALVGTLIFASTAVQQASGQTRPLATAWQGVRHICLAVLCVVPMVLLISVLCGLFAVGIQVAFGAVFSIAILKGMVSVVTALVWLAAAPVLLHWLLCCLAQPSQLSDCFAVARKSLKKQYLRLLALLVAFAVVQGLVLTVSGLLETTTVTRIVRLVTAVLLGSVFLFVCSKPYQTTEADNAATTTAQ